MSISPLSSLSSLIYSTAQTSPPSSIQEDLTELADALQSGDLQGAQRAFSNLQELKASQSSSSGSAPIPSGATGGSSANPIATDFAALGQALSSGNLGQAQSAFTQLKGAIQAAQQSAPGGGTTAVQGHRHHRHHAAGAGSSGSSPTSSNSAPTNTGGTVNLLG